MCVCVCVCVCVCACMYVLCMCVFCVCGVCVCVCWSLHYDDILSNLFAISPMSIQNQDFRFKISITAKNISSQSKIIIKMTSSELENISIELYGQNYH